MDLRNYYLYIIKDHVAHYFYLREQMIFQLFKEFYESRGKEKEMIRKQIWYITEAIPTLQIHRELVQHLQYRKDFFVKDGQYMIQNKRGSAQLFIQERKLSIQASGSLDSEMILMDILKNLDVYFIAIDLENERYGWIKPIKESHYS